MESIIYILSTIFIFVTFMLFKKSDEKISFIKFSIISVVCLMCYNALICFILGEFKITISLYLLSIINLIVGGILMFFIIKNKKMQKYTYTFRNIIALFVILIVTMVLAYLNFTSNLNINYATLDAGNHFAAAREFFQYGTLVSNLENEAITGSFMTGAYINTGILFMVFAPFFGKMNMYIVFMIFDVCTLFLTGMSLYVIIEKYIKTKIRFLLSLLMVILFLIGYPYLCFLYGYSYLQVGTLIFAIILNVLSLYQEEFNKKVLYIMLGLLNYGLFFSYCIFIPVIYLAELIYIIKKRREVNKKIFTKQNITIFIVVFLIAVVCGVFYFVIPHLSEAQSNNGEIFINLEGYIYRSIWANFIFLLPISLLCLKKKNDDTIVFGITIAILIILMAVFLIVINLLELPTYYYFKFNFLLWFMLWYGAIIAINTLENKLKIFASCYILLYMIIGIVVTINSKVEFNYSKYNIHENIKDVYEIYGMNKTVVTSDVYDLNSEQIKCLEYIQNNNIELKDNNLLVVGTSAQQIWIRGYFNYCKNSNIRVKEKNAEYYFSVDLDKWKNGEYDYLLVLNNYHDYEKYEYFYNLVRPGKVLYNNSSCTMYSSK